MATMRELRSQIRYALHQLNAQNAQFVFEDLCREVARIKITSEVLPGTGPVGAGGDQGRDFETIRVPFGESNEAKGMAFPVSIQASDILAKIESDVKKIVEQGAEVSHIYFFSNQNIAVGKRHNEVASFPQSI